uniref:NACHT-associated inactive Restriction Endonuclease 1 sensor domain-containing protein n=1 Tax=Candidatus Kentrum sp. FM TaxID=2126340 RepID=A0A450TCV8_9GAMM|nr:MAG: hypothetical protein BECKFM1743C_GA0114222_103281 [Candidatus Kentron sp. FM]VFJ64721.1 MAG: hypothetical protein BECKFM1743A_GA0114220_103632 [Candidatus Kentron sp. FM]VFK15263.1 MAG: hypothetical protein BECKFM1743B_GA0114221_103631 [Candidatus Kentron sp. FM]
MWFQDVNPNWVIAIAGLISAVTATYAIHGTMRIIPWRRKQKEIDTSTGTQYQGSEKAPKHEHPLPATPQSALHELTEQLDGWFNALEYQRESHDPQGEDFFEWIIKIPDGGRYSRVLVRGVAGEATKSHASDLLRKKETHGTDRAWLVAHRLVEPAARAMAEKNPELECVTFDELVDRDADFTKYFEWLDTEVKARGIDRYYVPLACRKGDDHYEDIDEYVDRWLDDPNEGQISVTGQFGTGKTWFGLHYAWRAAREYLDAKARGRQRPRLPLFIPLKEYAGGELGIELLFSGFFFQKHEIPLKGYSIFEYLNRTGKFLLIFDGFDEMVLRLNQQALIDSFWEIARAVVPGSKAILTSRTECFTSEQQARAVLNGEVLYTTKRIPKYPPKFDLIELDLLQPHQIREILERHRTDPKKITRIVENERLMDIGRRAIMIGFLLDALDSTDEEGDRPWEREHLDVVNILYSAVTRRLDRDIEMGRTFTSLADKLYFFCEISWELFDKKLASIHYTEFNDRIRQFFRERIQDDRDIDYWAWDLRRNGMFIRNEIGEYTPAHRSLAEFFAAYKFVAELGVLAPEFIGAARERLRREIDDDQEPKVYTWSNYFVPPDSHSPTKQLAPLREFTTEPRRVKGKDTRSFVMSQRLPKNTFIFATGLMSREWLAIDKLCRLCWAGTGQMAWNAGELLTYLRVEQGERIARALVTENRDQPLPVGVVWLLGEMGYEGKEVIDRLIDTVERFARGETVDPTAWWGTGWSLRKLGHFGKDADTRERDEEKTIAFLSQYRPAGYTLERACEHLKQTLDPENPDAPPIDPCDLVTIAINKSQLDIEKLYSKILSRIDLETDTIERHCRDVIWLCGHLQIEESIPGLIRCARNQPQSTNRNAATEALGKIGKVSPEVVDTLEKQLTDGYHRTRLHAAISLEGIRSTSSLGALEKALKEEEVPAVRDAMALAITRLRAT